MIAKWGFGPKVARLTSWRNPFHVVSRKQLYESRIKKLVDDYQNKSVAFVAIEPNDAKAILLSELGYGVEVAKDGITDGNGGRRKVGFVHGALQKGSSGQDHLSRTGTQG